MASRLVDIVRSTVIGHDIPDDLEPVLVACVARASAAWPNAIVDQDQFIRGIAERLDPDALVGSLEAMQTDDLYLACGCAAGDPGALAGFQDHCGPTIAIAIAAAGVAPSDRADVTQVVRQRLLVAPAPGTRPRISTYSARGSLQAWVRVVATREALRTLSHVNREVVAEDDELDRLAPDHPEDDPELGYLKHRYREEFKLALRAAVEALDDRARLLLRQHTLDRLGIDQLAALHGIHRATAARWVDAARQAVIAGTRRDLTRRLRLSKDELDSIIRLIQSRLDITLPDALAR